MESEKVKEIKDKLREEIFIANSFGDKLRRVETKDLQDILTLINELESENEALQKGIKRLKKRYEEAITKNADECVKKFCETTMYKEQGKLVNENQQLKDRIAELEYGIAKSMLGCEFLPECTNDKLKQFSHMIAVEYAIPYCKIDETLKEFLKE